MKEQKRNNKKRGVLSKKNSIWTEVQQKYRKERDGRLTSGTTKLMAISSRGRGSKTWKIGGGSLCWSSWSSRAIPPPGRWIWGYRMTRWRKSTGEGSIYRTKWAGANLTSLFAASVKSEGVQVDMVTICTIIKGLRRWFDSKRSRFWRYFTVQDRLVGPSVVFCNGNTVDERIGGRFGLRGWEIRGTCRRIGLRLFRFGDWLPNWEK